MKKLTVKEASFAAKIIEGLEPSAALRASKYKTENMSPSVIAVEAQKLLKRPHISLTIEQGKKRLLARSIMTREEALERLSFRARIAVTDIYDFEFKEIEQRKDGTPIIGIVWTLKDLKDIKPEIAVCIKSVSCGKDGPMVELYDSDGAIKQLRAMEGWDAAKQYDHKSSDGSMSPNEQLSDEQVKEQMESRGLRIDFDK